MTAISPDPTRLQLLPTFISHTFHLSPSTPFHSLPPSHTLALTHQNGHRSRPLDLQAVLPGNLTLCRSLYTRRPFAVFRANLETHFLFWGRCCAPRVLMCSCSNCRRLGRIGPLAQSAHQYSGQQRQRRLCRAATALTGLVPQSVRTSARLRLHQEPKQTLGSITTSEKTGRRLPTQPSKHCWTTNNCQHVTKATREYCCQPWAPNTAAATSGRQKTRQTRKSITPSD